MKSPTKKELVVSRARCLGLGCLEGVVAKSDVKTAGINIYYQGMVYYFPKEIELIQLLKEAKVILNKESVLPQEKTPTQTPIQTTLF